MIRTVVAAVAMTVCSAAVAAPRGGTFTTGDKTFQLNGKPFVVKAAELHYPRIPRPYWEHRIKMCKALGMNTVCLYVFWNIHEQSEGEYDFTGQNDIAEFCRLAQKNGMYVIVRPGPYVCAEWEMGGLPWWLLKKKDIRLREQDPYFMERVGKFMAKVGEQLAPLTIQRGGPIIMVLLFGSYTGFVMAILIAALATMMVGESIVFFILLLASAMVAIYFCSNANSRYRVIMGGVIYGLFIAFFSFTIGLLTDKPLDILWRQSLLAIVAGALTGIFALVLLPIVERIFKTYSNIALLDYTDFNNPLLRRLQIEAPGTYHHSVMVSYLAEAAAATVGANPMICRIGALFHDIGKITKPEFFSENQKNGRNLHDEQNPSMSALIIRNHVREGIELAKAAKLPQQAIDSIHQHHGTTIIAYFYNKAMKLAEGAEQSVDPAQALRDAGIEESTFRHDGRKPQTVENAILMLADSCEAASRSLKKITKHGIEDLVNVIVRSKMNDGQFDECPITVKQLSKIKQSFVFTMLNMMHTRVQYNDDKKQ